MSRRASGEIVTTFVMADDGWHLADDEMTRCGARGDAELAAHWAFILCPTCRATLGDERGCLAATLEGLTHRVLPTMKAFLEVEKVMIAQRSNVIACRGYHNAVEAQLVETGPDCLACLAAGDGW